MGHWNLTRFLCGFAILLLYCFHGYCVPVKQFDIENYEKLNFTLSKQQLLDVAKILVQINEFGLNQKRSGDDEWQFDAVDSNSGGGKNVTGGNEANQTTDDGYLFEGDILLSPQQANNILDDLKSQLDENILDESRPRSERSAMLYNTTARWTNLPIKYDLDSSIGPTERTAIDEGLEFWRTHTCLWFEHRSGMKEGDYLTFFKGDDDNCYSHVGKIGGKQPISIGRNCAKLGYVAHEIGHALGMWHEQARPDSSSYIQILWQNVQNTRTSNFLKRSWHQTETYGIPYDMGSVMHYGPYAFTSSDKYPTIETKIPAYQKTIGQREEPSFLDVKAVNKLYCEGKCQSQYPCSNGGYTHPGFCNGCLCPGGLGGTYCDNAESPKNAYCGGLLYVQDEWTNISSPNYPDHYGNNQRCNWLLRAGSIALQPVFRRPQDIALSWNLSMFSNYNAEQHVLIMLK